MAQPCWDNTTRRATPGTALNTSGFGQTLTVAPVVTNAYPLLTQPGQWYLNDTTHQLFYIPRPGENMATADVVVPRLQTLVAGVGTPAAPIRDIAFHGITFSYGGWLGPSGPNGYSSFQAGTFLTGEDAYELQGACDSPRATCPYTNYPQVPGNVTFAYDQHLTFSDDSFAHFGAAGLSLGDGSQDDLVQGKQLHRHLRKRAHRGRVRRPVGARSGPHLGRPGAGQRLPRPCRRVPGQPRHRGRLRPVHDHRAQPDRSRAPTPVSPSAGAAGSSGSRR